MKTNQPIWRLVANLGDANPIEYGGLFVYEDTTGVYPPEIERIEPYESGKVWTVHRAILEPCTYVNGVLSDNPSHPEHAAWFADSIGSIADFCGVDAAEFIRMITAGTILERAEAWRMVGDYHGWDNLDGYPCRWNREQVVAKLEVA